ncbi:MAG TPA: serine/threonine-protein kinase, partial [Bryobacteraceae bacterium]
SALHHAHRLEILHRDIKPANILLTDDDTVKITDFGIARAIGSERLTRDTRLVGTLEYLAPERIKGEEGDFRSDLYSAGAVLYELLTNRLPFERTSDFELMRAHLEEMPLPLRQSSPSIAPALEMIVLRALAKRPEDRFATAKEMRDALAAVDLRCAPPETRFVEAAVAIPETKFVETPPAARKGKTRALWLGLASVGAVLVIVLVVLLTRSANQNKSTQNKAMPAPPPAPAEAKKIEPTPPPSNSIVTDTAPPAVPNEEEAAQEKKAERARRRAAALKALEQ